MKHKLFTLLLTLMVGTNSLFATGGTMGYLSWSLSAGVLTISGSGWMEGGGYGEYPWFDLRSSITSVVIEDGVYNIAPCAFIDCANLTTVSIPNTIEEIRKDAFGLCSSLTTITLPRSLTTIGGGAFGSCSSLTSVKCEAVTPPTIGDYDYEPQIIYPESPIALYVPAGSIALYQNSEIWDDFSPILPLTQYCGDNLTWVWDRQTDSLFISGTGAMWDYTNYNQPWTSYSLKGVTFSEGITSIGDRAFESGGKIQSITIPSTVSYIGARAFYGCLSLQKMVCEAVVPPTLADSSSLKFGGRSNSLPVCLYVPAESVEAYKAADYWKNMAKIIPIGTTEKYCGENLTYEVVDGALSISGTGDMWNYYFSSNATTAPWGPDITSVSLPEGLTSVGDFAFYQCKNITSITIPSTITYLGLAAFYHCGVDYNGSDADAIINLTSVTCLAPTPPSMSSGSYGGLMGIGPVFGPVICLDGGNLCTYFYGQQVPLYVPAGSIELYQTADQWEYFNPILPIPEQPIDTTITVAQAIEIGQALEHRAQTENMYIVVGYVSALIGQETDFELYNNQTYWITDERGSTAASAADGAFQVFRGTASEKVQVGDKVSVYGVISRYDEIIESVRPQVIILEKNPIEEPAEVVQLPYSESFLGDMGLFTVHDVAHDTLPYVWLTTDLYGMKASGYRYGPHNTESWLVSPKISLPAAGNINMTFETCLNYASDDYNSCAVKILVDNTWSDLQFNKWPAGHSWVFDTVTTSLDAYAGNEIQIAFVYRSSTLYSNATWEVRNLEIKQIEKPIVYSPIQIGDLYYILDRENQTAVVTSKSFYQSDDLILVNEGWDIAEAVIPATVTYNDTVYEVTRIGWWAFRNCQNLTSVTIGDNVHVIDGAFYNCTNLQEVNMSNSVDTIDSYSFYECPALTSIVIPASIDSMGLSAFQRCNNLTSVTINSNAVVGKDFNSEYIPDLAYIFGWQVQEYIIGEGVTRIGYHAFNHFSQKISQAISHLTSISLPSTLTDIASEAFYNCVKLTSLTIPDGVATIGEDAFLNVRSVFYNGNATGAPWGALCLNSFCETEPEPEPEPIEPAVISVTDNSLEDWNDLPTAYVAEAVCPIDAEYRGLKNVKVYATKSYINILVEPNMEDVTDLEWVPFDIFFDTDNSDLTGGYGDIFEDANTDILLEGSLFVEGETISYAPCVFEWWGEIGGYGWEWTDPEIEHTADDCWGALVCEGALDGCSSQYVDGKFEIQILRNNIPATWNDSVFGIGMGIMQSWDFVGILPISSPTDDNFMGAANKLKVRIHKANDPTEVEPIGASSHEGVTKFIHNGQIFIRRGDKVYTLQGQEVK